MPDEPPIARAREELKTLGLHPASLPLGVDIEAWLKGGKTGWDAFPNTGLGKMDAESVSLTAALDDRNIELLIGAHVGHLELAPDGKTIAAVHYRHQGQSKKVSPKLVILSAGAIMSAAILLRSPSPTSKGLANSSDQIGRNFMNHNSAAMLAIDPRRRNDSVYQKTLMLNDYYLSDGKGGKPLGNVQLLGKIDGNMLAANVKLLPRFALDWMAAHAVDWYLMCEDLPDPESRVMVDGDEIVLQWRRTNMQSLEGLAKVMRANLRACGYPIVLSQPVRQAHAVASVRHGHAWATTRRRHRSTPFCRSFDHRNLFVVDGGFLPTSAAVNPALTIAAQALRVADHIRKHGAGVMTRRAAIVTGANRGIGLAISEALAASGFDILAADLASAPSEALQAGVERNNGRLAYQPFDLADLSTHAGVIEAAEGIRLHRLPRQQCRHGLAGARRSARPHAGEFRQRALQSTCAAPSFSPRPSPAPCSPHRQNTAARSSPSPRSAPNSPRLSVPTTASPRPGLSMWVKNLALRLAPDGIGVFEVRPGIIRTDMTAAATEKYDGLIAEGLVPSRRWGEAEDVGPGGCYACRRLARLRHRLDPQCRRRVVGTASVKV